MKRLRSVLSPMVTTAGILALSGAVLAQSPSESHRAASARAHEIMSSAPCPLPRVTKDKITEEQGRDLAQAFADKNMSGFKVVRPLGYGGGYTTMCYQTSQTVAVQSPSVATGTRTADRDAADDRVERERRLKGLAPIIGNRTADRDSAEDRIERERRTQQASPSANADSKIVTASSARPLVLYSVEYSVDLKNAAGQTRNLCVDQFGTVSEFCSDFGFAGATGPMGPAGPMGAQGPAGVAGSQSQASAVKAWSTFKDFLFSFDQSEIRANETSHVTDIAAYMKQNPSAQVGIDGHTDPRGTDAYNQSLSERRVNAIREALVTAGVADNRIKAGAFGESQPKCNESTEACWQADRRVEVLIGNSQTASR